VHPTAMQNQDVLKMNFSFMRIMKLSKFVQVNCLTMILRQAM